MTSVAKMAKDTLVEPSHVARPGVALQRALPEAQLTLEQIRRESDLIKTGMIITIAPSELPADQCRAF
jgi:hypothetical protein